MLNRFLLVIATVLIAADSIARDVDGYLFDEAGQAVARATISAYSPEPSDLRLQRILSAKPERTPLKRVVTDANGVFRLTGLPDAIVEVEAIASGYAPRLIAHLPGQSPLTITMTSAPLVDGSVTAAGRPVAGATVTWAGNNEHFVSAVTDSSGRYRVPDPSKWGQDVLVFHPDFATSTGLRRAPDPRHELDKGVLVRGVVQRRDETGVANARILIDGIPAGTSDAEGRFVVRAPDAYRNVVARLDGQIGSAPRGDNVVVTLQPGRRIEGLVRVNGAPLAGGVVLLQRHQSEGERQFSVVSDGNGRFRATPLLPGRYSVFPMIGAGTPLRTAEQQMVEGPDPHGADLRSDMIATHHVDLLRLEQVTGRVVDEDGKAVAAAEVLVVPVGTPALHFATDSFSIVRTTPAGTFTVPVPIMGSPQSFHVVATKPGFGFFRSEPFTMENLSRRVTVVMSGATNVRGRVVNTSGDAVPGALVTFASAEEIATTRDVTILLEPHFQRRAVRTDPSGEFRLMLPADTYDFAIQADGYQTATLVDQEIRGTSDALSVQLQAGAAIRGRVVRGDIGVAGVYVSVSGIRRGGETANMTGADGSFVVESLAPGTYRVMFNKHEEMVQEMRTVEAPGNIVVELPLTGTVRGRVVAGDSGEPVPQIVVGVEPAGGDGGPRHIETTRSARMHHDVRAENGRFELQLPAGQHVITVGAPAFGTGESIEVTVAAGEIRDVEIRLSRGLTITGRVRDESGNPVSDAQVVIVPDQRGLEATRMARRFGSSHAQTNENGEFTLSGVDPGAAVLTVRKQGFLMLQREFSGGSSGPLDIQLSRGLTLNGLVLHNSRPVAGADIGASSPAVGADHQGTRSDDAGRFTLSGLMPATYTIYAGKEGLGHAETRVDVNTEHRVTVNIDARATGVVFGTVHGLPQGRLLRSVVMVHGERGAAEGTINSDGTYRVEKVPSGPMRVSAHAETRDESRSSAERLIDVREGLETHVDLEFSEAARVAGRLTWLGRPLNGARVVFMTAGGAMVSDTSRNGEYSVVLPVLGTYRVFVHSEEVTTGQYQAVHAIERSQRLDIDLREQTISGVVVDASTRAPIAGAVVSLAPARDPENQIFGETITSAEGRFHIITGAAGQLRLSAGAHGYGQQVMAVNLSAAALPSFVLELAPAAASRIRVVDARSGTPLEAHITFADASGNLIAVRPERAPDGSIAVTLTPGRYVVTANVGGFGSAKTELNAPGALEIPVSPGEASTTPVRVR